MNKSSIKLKLTIKGVWRGIGFVATLGDIYFLASTSNILIALMLLPLGLLGWWLGISSYFAFSDAMDIALKEVNLA